jgi:hypothetical protein
MTETVAKPAAPEALPEPRLLDPEFIADCPYGPGAQLIDALYEVDPARSFVRARWPTTDEMPITRDQRAHPQKHPRHVSGGLMVHMTGMAGFLHAYYVLGLRHAEGWVGFGGRIHSAKFRALAPPGAPIVVDCTATKLLRRPTRIVGRYDLKFWQGSTLVYEGDQTAMWLKVEEGKAMPTLLGDA